MNQIQREKVLKKLEKIKKLAERGVGGEKETAMRMYEELCRKYDISKDEAEAELVQVRWFSYGTKLEEELLMQIFYKVTGSSKSYAYTGKYSRRKKRGCACTELEAMEIEMLFSFYKEEMEREIEAFMIAFKQKNNLFPDETARVQQDFPERELTEEEKRKFKKAELMRMAMDRRTPPKAEIEAKEV